MILTNRAAALLLVAFCLALYLPGITALPPFDQDEARFAQAARQMLESGDFVQIRFQAEPRSKKPVLSYWLQASGAAITGQRDAIWPYRLPSIAGLTLATLLTFWCGIRLFGREAAALGAALFAASIMAVVQAHMARADAVLIPVVVAAQGALAAMHGAARNGQPPPRLSWLVFWVAQGLGVLIKGPILAMTSLLTIAALIAVERDWSWLRPIRVLPGVAIASLIAAPWFIAAGLSGVDGFVAAAITEDLLPKLLGAHEEHGGPPGYYLATGLIMFWPASLLAGPAILFAWRNRSMPAVRFCLAWIVPTWIVYELVPTKLPHYTLPAYPALALVAAAAVMALVGSGMAARTSGWNWRTRWIVPPWVAIGLGCGAFALGVPLAIDGRLGFWPVAAAAAALAAAGAGWMAWRGDWRRAIATALIGAGLWSGITLQFVLPSVDGIWLSRSLADAFAASGAVVPNAHPPIAVAGLDHASVIFLLGTDTVVGSGAVVADHLADRAGAMAAVSTASAEDFETRLRLRGVSARKLGQVGGFDYVWGVWRTFDLYVAAPEAALR